ncbi:MAG: hypothetical protein J07HQW2_03350 [Haloquadratum walsbyi J07HQW2]|uniref:Uncharacterized protein n=1 Tax=Haloquadratum walsbyi J07HQW2 TaxID=1238425 RepID=U1PWS2_9EURY|nr:MAG: hypothetical protein J07HQW2_03350 [Haloquadratum walsbyi J07HQW2]
MEVTVSFVFLESRFEFAVVGDFAVFVPPVLGVVSGDAPQFGRRRREPTLVEVVVIAHLGVVEDCCSIGAGCLQHRH